MKQKLLALSFLLILAVLPFTALTQAQSTQIYWGAWVGDAHIGSYSLLQTFESQVGKGVSIWDWIQIWTRPADSENQPNFDTSQMNQARNAGIIPMVSWSPEQNVDHETGNQGDFYNLQSILNGDFDSYFAAWGAASAAWGHPYFVRPMWEFTGYWTSQDLGGYGIYPFGGGNGNTAAMFVAAWQYMVNHVRAAGGTQITWVWCPGNVGDSQATLASVYPGNGYVDWVGTDVYPSYGSTFTANAGTELTNIQAVSSKPVMIPELGYTGTDSADSAAWWADFLANVPSYIKAVVVWEMPSASLTVVSPSEVLSAFRSGIGSSYFSPSNFAAISSTPIQPLGSVSPTPTPTPTPTTTPTPNPSITPTSTPNPKTDTIQQNSQAQNINPSTIDLNLSLTDWIIFSVMALLLISILVVSVKKR